MQRSLASTARLATDTDSCVVACQCVIAHVFCGECGAQAIEKQGLHVIPDPMLLRAAPPLDATKPSAHCPPWSVGRGRQHGDVLAVG